MKITPRSLWILFVVVVVAHAVAAAFFLAGFPFAAAPARANAAQSKPSARTVRSESCESPFWPVLRCAPPAATFGVPSAPICNPAIVGSRQVFRGRFLVVLPVKQYGVPIVTPTLPAVAGLISTRA